MRIVDLPAGNIAERPHAGGTPSGGACALSPVSGEGVKGDLRSMLDVRCWMFDVGCSMFPSSAAEEHRTSNTEHPTLNCRATDNLAWSRTTRPAYGTSSTGTRCRR